MCPQTACDYYKYTVCLIIFVFAGSCEETLTEVDVVYQESGRAAGDYGSGSGGSGSLPGTSSKTVPHAFTLFTSLLLCLVLILSQLTRSR